MIHYTKYAEEKFELLNKYKVFFRREEIEDCLNMPDKISKKGKYLSAKKDNIKVVYQKHGNLKKVVTFYPVK
ncbi:hypothetical protein C0583_00780 [Candidatus Parcubacteria bacterium]|nr:MAG: hypothetical protein C0583_00780 [Candidatus Parcubacteria bacterium]